MNRGRKSFCLLHSSESQLFCKKDSRIIQQKSHREGCARRLCLCAVVVKLNMRETFQPTTLAIIFRFAFEWARRRRFFHVTSLSWLQTLYCYVAGNIKHNNLRTMRRRARSALKLFSRSRVARCCNIFNQFLRLRFPPPLSPKL